MIVIQMNICCLPDDLPFNAQHQQTTSTANNPICTHLSNQILLYQVSCGKAEPGIVSKKVTMISQKIPGATLGLIFFRKNFLQC